MSTEVALVLLIAWPVFGLAASYELRRRGHDLFSWAALGAFFGPLTIPLAIESIRREQRGKVRVVHTGTPGPGTVDVLVGLDGSPESQIALRRAIEVLGPRIGRLTLARVVDYEAGSDTAGEASLEVRRQAEAELAASESDVAPQHPDTVILAGDPATALCDAAVGGGYEVLVIGTRGQGLSKALLGSTAERLGRDAPVPVFMYGGSGVASEPGADPPAPPRG